MKIIDTFMLNNELDLLEFRLEYLYDHVDHFVIVESTVTHRGVPKTTYYSLYKDRFKKYEDKIIHVLTTDVPKKVYQENLDNNPLCDGDDYIYREQLQRKKILDGLRELELDYEDIVLVSNIDEVPNIQSFSKLPKFLSISPLKYKQNWLVWNYNFKRRKKWQGTSAFYYTHLIQNPDELNLIRLVDVDEFQNEYFTMESGWHFNWFGNEESFITKIYTTSFRERDQHFYYRRKNFRDLYLSKRYPSINTSHIETLEETKTNELPHNYKSLPYFDGESLPNVYDTFIYNGEDDALLMRLYELYDAVDYFVILEGNLESDYKFKNIQTQLKQYDDKIIYVQLEDYDNVQNIEEHEINMLQKSLNYLELKDNDFIYFSQIECIPSYESLEVNYFDFNRFELEFVTLKMRWFYQDFKNELNDNYYGTILTSYENMNKSSLHNFYLMKDEPVHSIIQFRGWYLCNFFKNEYPLYDGDVILEVGDWDYYPQYYERYLSD